MTAKPLFLKSVLTSIYGNLVQITAVFLRKQGVLSSDVILLLIHTYTGPAQVN